MEITSLTFVTLSILLVAGLWTINKILSSLKNHDKIEYTTLDKPLRNKNKWWYH